MSPTTISKFPLSALKPGPMHLPPQPVQAIGLEIFSGPDRNGNTYYACRFVRCADGARARGVIPAGKNTAEFFLSRVFPDAQYFEFESHRVSRDEFRRATKNWPAVNLAQDVLDQWEKWGEWTPAGPGK